MPANQSYDIFLLERGTKLTLISQSFNLIHHQPTFTLTRHDTVLSISKTVHKFLDATCQDILASERMSCIIDKVQENIQSTGNFCLPFQYNNVFTQLNSAFPQCIDDQVLSSENILVNAIGVDIRSR